MNEFSGEFVTPESVLELISALAEDIPSKRILDPAVGTGGLLISVAAKHTEKEEVIGVDINQEIIKKAQSNTQKLPQFRLINADFFTVDNEDELGLFDLVVCNPPFGQRHITHADGRKFSGESMFIDSSLKLLKPDGYLLVVVSEGFLFRRDTAKFRANLVATSSVEAIISLPPGEFQYTGIPASVLIIKNAKQSDKVFLAHYAELQALQALVSNFRKHESNKNLSQGFWIDATELKESEIWTYRFFRGKIELEQKRRSSAYPIKFLSELVSFQRETPEGQESLLIPKAGTNIMLKSELPEGKDAKNYLNYVPADDTVLPRYIQLYLSSEDGKRQLNALTTGSVIPHLTKRALESLYIEVPDLKTQWEIVSTGNKINEEFTRLQFIMQSFQRNPFNYSDSLELIEKAETDDTDPAFEELLWPLATSYRIATKGSSDPNNQLQSYFKLFELIAAFNAVVLLSALPEEIVAQNDTEIWTEDKEQYEMFAFGTWVGLCGRLAKLYRKLDKHTTSVLPFGKEFYQGLISKKLLNCMKPVNEKRNSVGHGGVVPDVRAKTMISEIEPLLDKVFQMLLTYASVQLIYPQSMRRSNGIYLVTAKRLEGTSYPFDEEQIITESDMDTEVLHLFDPASDTRMKLNPDLIKLVQCEHCGNWSVYFFSKMDGNKAKYRSFQTEIHDYYGAVEGLLETFR